MNKQGTIPSACHVCQSAFLATRSQVRRGQGIYCSNRCRWDGHRSARREVDVELQFDGMSARLPLRSKDGSIRAYAVIDAADIPDIAAHRWALADGYAVRCERRNGRPENIKLHREVLGLKRGDGAEVDHINRDRLDCRRTNLRVVLPGQNAQNRSSNRQASSRFRGVSYHRVTGKWAATVGGMGRHHHLGLFATEEQAALVARFVRSQILPFSVEVSG